MKEMNPINQRLSKLIQEKEGGNMAEIARKLGGVTGQAIGKYARGRTIPVDFINKWKAVYGEDLMATNEPIVPRGTSLDEPKVSSQNDETALSLAAKAIAALQRQLDLADFEKKDIVNRLEKDKDKLEKDKDRMTDDKAELYSIIKGLTSVMNSPPFKQSQK